MKRNPRTADMDDTRPGTGIGHWTAEQERLDLARILAAQERKRP